MDLKTYLKKNNMTIIGFAERFSIPYATVWRVVTGEGTPTARTAKQVEKATEGAVPAVEILGLS
jgi:predicted transcriptional regulator